MDRDGETQGVRVTSGETGRVSGSGTTLEVRVGDVQTLVEVRRDTQYDGKSPDTQGAEESLRDGTKGNTKDEKILHTRRYFRTGLGRKASDGRRYCCPSRFEV